LGDSGKNSLTGSTEFGCSLQASVQHSGTKQHFINTPVILDATQRFIIGAFFVSHAGCHSDFSGSNDLRLLRFSRFIYCPRLIKDKMQIMTSNMI